MKLSSSDIIGEMFDLELSFNNAKDKDEIISISDSQVIRWIDSINKKDRNKEKLVYDEIKSKIKRLKKNKTDKNIKKEICELYNTLNKMQFIPELINVVMNKPSDIDKFKDGFKINGRTYLRFVGSPNQVKKSTVMYTCIHDELNKLIENDHDPNYKIVPAKYEAYKALALSGSYPVTNTNRILVVDDLITHFTEDVIFLDDSETIEPKMEHKTEEIELNASDGFGLITPELAEIWSEDMRLDYTISGCCVRHSFTKGMVAVFDFREFARKHGKRVVKDVWGKEHDINNIDIILTTSMLKLWSAYNGIDDFIRKSEKNGYGFCVTKVTPKELDEVRTLNYQFIQSYDLTDEQIKELISPTVNEIKDVLGGDINKTILFLKGINVTDENVNISINDYVKALMIDKRTINDSYVIDRINMLIKKKIDDAKIGVLKVHGNFGIVIGDPYALCQKIFELDIKNEDYGLLKAGEIYHKFWQDKNVDEVVCFRSPMSCHANIRKVKINNQENSNYWYKHCSNLVIVNAHDSFCHALNGCDFDSDLVFTTNNKVLVDNWTYNPTIMCVQKSAEKFIVTEDLLREGNKKAFGSKVGAITNRVTSMFDLLPLFDTDSEEYKTLMYRIKCGQLYQQADIDACKGIISNPMPKYWYQKIKAKEGQELSDEDRFNNSICVDKKPYFMKYIYPDINSSYNNFTKDALNKCVMLYGMSFEELCSSDELTDEQAEFIENYYKYIPVNDNGCTMNRLCHMVENEFKGYTSKLKAEADFDYRIFKSGNDYDYKLYLEILKVYHEYTAKKMELSKNKNSYKVSREDFSENLRMITEDFKEKCAKICNNSIELCDIVLDICYSNNNSKSFAWEMCGDQIVQNLLRKNDGRINYLVRSDDGNVEFNGYKFEERTMTEDVDTE